ncbi:MAG TPA: hypothetical protein PLB10_01200 [Thiolinea sp.]|nr:hypothetical protein [Thiolinea sp.]
MQISIRELKANPSFYIRQAGAGHSVWITAHKRVVARLLAASSPSTSRMLGEIPNVSWNGEKPAGGRLLPSLKGASLADTVLEKRRQTGGSVFAADL